ncbi:succinate dehydrogenase domain protein [Mycobacterium intracellulare]|nr:succinate dehydrogenase domain protein [Mycobacterium intracellulare]
MRSGAAPEERTLTQLCPAGVTLAVLGEVGRAGAGGIQAGHHGAVVPLHLTVDGHREAADREARVHRAAERQIEHRPRPIVLRRKEFRLLVEIGILTGGGELVVAVQRGREVAGRDAKRGFHFRDRLVAIEETDQRHRGHLGVRLVDDQVGGLLRLLEHERRGARMVGVLGDEALALLVDDDTGQQDFGRVGRRGDEQLVHVLGGPARRDPHPDGQPVVVGVAQDVGRRQTVMLGAPRLAQSGSVLGDHLRIHREPTGRDDDGLGLDGARFGEVLPGDAHHGAVVVQDQIGRPGLVAGLHAQGVGAFHQQVDDHGRAAQLAGDRHGVPARRRLGPLAEGPHLFVARVAEALGARRHDDFARVVAALELKAQVFQPVEMLDAAVAVGADLVEFGLTRHLDEVLVHLLGGVVLAGRLLHRGPAAEVKVPSGKGSGAAGRGRAFEHEHPRPFGRRTDRGAAAGDAEADHQHVDLVGPRRHVVGADCWRYFGAHWRHSS